MMNIPSEIEKVLEKIYKQTKPVSIFIYGSRAREDYKENSDYEIGVLYKKENYIQRKDLNKLHSLNKLNIFPFYYNDFIKYQLDTPFPKSIYLREVVTGGRTIKGKRIIENIKPPSIKLIDLLEGVVFQQGYALAATHSYKQNDLVTSSTHFTKSLLYGMRVLIILEKKEFPLTFDEIVEAGKRLIPDGEVNDLMVHAIDVRNGKKPDIDMLYANISFLNKVVLKKVKAELQKGDRIIL